MMCIGQTSTSESALLQLYNATCAEITRYRDREWRNQTIFTATMVAIVGFILLHKTDAKSLARVFDVSLVLLAAGNIFYTAFAHNALTEQRNILARLRLLLGYHDVQVGGKDLLPAKWKKAPETFRTGWCRGLLSHLLPFWAVDVWLVCEGMYLLHTP
jgi:hypothetical protein